MLQTGNLLMKTTNNYFPPHALVHPGTLHFWSRVAYELIANFTTTKKVHFFLQGWLICFTVTTSCHAYVVKWLKLYNQLNNSSFLCLTQVSISRVTKPFSIKDYFPLCQKWEQGAIRRAKRVKNLELNGLKGEIWFLFDLYLLCQLWSKVKF